VAGIAPLSTWVAWEVIQIAEGLKNAGAEDERRRAWLFRLAWATTALKAFPVERPRRRSAPVGCATHGSAVNSQ